MGNPQSQRARIRSSAPDHIAEAVGGGEDLAGMSLEGLSGAAASALNAESVARESTRLCEWRKPRHGADPEREVPPVKDWRFADPVWRQLMTSCRLCGGYLASATRSTGSSTTTRIGASASAPDISAGF